MASGTAVARKSQADLFEKTLEDAALERKLNQRAEKQRDLAEARAAFEEVDAECKGRMEELKINSTVRIGGFVVSVTKRQGREVESFTVKPGKIIRIKALSTEEE